VTNIKQICLGIAVAGIVAGGGSAAVRSAPAGAAPPANSELPPLLASAVLT